MTATIASVDTLVDRLGGPAEAAAALRCNVKTLRMWKMRRAIPPVHYLKHTKLLRELSIEAAPGIWKMGSLA